MSIWHEARGAEFLAANDMIASWERRMKEPFEPQTWAFVQRLISGGRGGQAVDVGASTGWYAIPLAQAGIEVWAFEPNRRVYARLLENARRNRYRFHARRLALSSRAGKAIFYHNPAVPLTSGGSIEAPTCSAPQAETVDMAALDDFAAEFSALTLVKIDVEGHEAAVLAGAEAVIAQHRPALILEANTEAAREGLANWLKDHGYRWKAGDGRNMLCTPK